MTFRPSVPPCGRWAAAPPTMPGGRRGPRFLGDTMAGKLMKNIAYVVCPDTANAVALGPNPRRVGLVLSLAAGTFAFVNFGAPAYDPNRGGALNASGIRLNASGNAVVPLLGEHWAQAIREEIHVSGTAFPSAVWIMELFEEGCDCLEGTAGGHNP